MSAERTCLLCQPPLVPLLTPRQDCLLCPRSHSALLLSGFRGQADQENRSPWVLEHWPRGSPRGGFHSSQGGLSLLKVLTACPCPSSRCLPACFPARTPTCGPLPAVTMPRRHRSNPMPEGNAARSGGTLRRPRPVLLQPQRRSAPPPTLLSLRVLPRAPLLLSMARSFREPWPLALLMQGLHVQDLMKVPRALRRKVQVPPRQPLAKIFWPGRPGYSWSSCWRSTPRRSPSRRRP